MSHILSDDRPRASSDALPVIKGSMVNIIGKFCFVTNNCIVKYFGLPESQLLFGRFGIQCILAIICWIILKLAKYDKTMNRNWYGDKGDVLQLWIRGAVYFCTVLSSYYAVLKIPVGDHSFIYFALKPILVVILAHTFLHEALPKWYVMASCTVLSITGILLMAQPTFVFDLLLQRQQYQPLDTNAVCLVAFGACCGGVANVMIRSAKKSHFLQLELSASTQSALLWIPLLMVTNQFVMKVELIGRSENGFGWQFDANSLFWTLMIGCIGFSGLVASVISYQYADATQIVLVEYIHLVFAMLYQIFLFGDMPNKYEVVGAGCIVLGCGITLSEKVREYYAKKGHVQYDEVQMTSSDQDASEPDC